MPNPEQRVLDEIDQLVEESLERGIRSGEYDGHVNLRPDEDAANTDGAFVDHLADWSVRPVTYTGVYDDFTRREGDTIGSGWSASQDFPILRVNPERPAGGLWMYQFCMDGVWYRVSGVLIAEGDVVRIERDGDDPPVMVVRHGEEERTYPMEVVDPDTP
ncbi:hypothetical protein [Nocardia wallacei]|uniref:hypothetical protein n=1 Tax=Nocardia wallacei TaxID=480035 RepID=UPI0024564B0A|nr:hypothetical protein [Nocardia wallacei]